jgi:predicted AlkP superfamily pyrophosphatase or phosphodiesterase
MPAKLLVIDIVGLTPGLIGERTPRLRALAADGFQAPMQGILPAVTCSAQATLLTGLLPREHGVVGNGWYFRELSEVWFWRQSNRLVEGAKLWERARERRPGFTCAKLFWWYNLYSSADWTVTPRPIYPADGRKLPSIYTEPPELKPRLEAALGPFPFFEFWGPRAGLPSSEWIARAAARVIEDHRPDLTLVYLPHLDYDFQRFGPRDPRSLRALEEVDRLAGRLIDKARGAGLEVVALSEYGITEVDGSVSINRVLRRAGFLRVQETPIGELLDAGASRAFAVSDHQTAHVYVREPRDLGAVKAVLAETPGVDVVLDEAGKRELGLDHPRAGELVAVAAARRWFDYYYWLDDDRAPDFARTVDIHRKPGYDPVELFLDPRRRFVRARILWRLLQKKLGFRALLDVIPLDPALVRGSHGRLADAPADGPVFISSSPRMARDALAMTDVQGLLLEALVGA